MEQLVQVPEFAAENLPFTHVPQELAPACEYLPAAQLKHPEAPTPE
jgi:hypothetical protein